MARKIITKEAITCDLCENEVEEGYYEKCIVCGLDYCGDCASEKEIHNVMINQISINCFLDVCTKEISIYDDKMCKICSSNLTNEIKNYSEALTMELNKTLEKVNKKYKLSSYGKQKKDYSKVKQYE